MVASLLKRLAVAGVVLLVGCGEGLIEGGAPLAPGAGGALPAVVAGCAAGQAECAGTCFDLLTSNLNCGACGNACAPGAVCTAGVCSLACGAGQADCGGICATVASDLTNCGSCGVVCAPGLYCSSGSCSATCAALLCPGTTGIECVDPQTNPSNCGACGQACPAGYSCVTGACSLLCPTGRAACGGTCVDVTADPNNCGYCGNVCAGQPCLGGQCGCATGQGLCDGACVDLATNPLHCGACGVTCGDGGVCTGGVCACGAGETQCGTGCFDLLSDASHCGGCNQPCPTGQACNAGSCGTGCGAGTTDCTGSCVDTQTSRLHCGACGNVCADGLVCAASACVCASGTLCGVACVDVQTNSQNCGTCGVACTGGQTCTGGACTCAAGQGFCDGICVPLADNEQHCGACGVACSATQECVGSACTCPGGATLCGDTCVDLQTSSTNCGACANACAGGQSCEGGVCRCSDGMLGCGTLCVDTLSNNEHCGACDAACATGRSCTNGACTGIVGDGPDGCSGEAHSIELTKLALLQGVEVALMDGGSAVAVGSRSADLVQQREAVLRVFFTLGGEWVDREVSVRLHLTNGGVESTLYQRQVLSEPSVQGSLDTTVQVPIDASRMTADARYWVEVVECAASVGPLLAPRFPATGDLDVSARATGPLKIAFVPVSYTAGGTTWQPDTSAAALAVYTDYLAAMYPTTEIQTSVTSSISTPAPLDFNAMLDDTRAKRQADDPGDDVYYMGIVKPAATMRDYCGGSCTTGVGYVVDDGAWSASFRVATAVAFGSESSAETIAHELGHNHGREHAPCGVSGDANYPYSNGSIGTWGFDRRSGALQDPSDVTDIMSYCAPQWVSDYTFQAFLERVASLNGATSGSVVNLVAPQRWLVARADATGLRWGHPIQKPQPPTGKPEVAWVVNERGVRLAELQVYLVPVSHAGGMAVLVPEPLPSWYGLELARWGVLPFNTP